MERSWSRGEPFRKPKDKDDVTIEIINKPTPEHGQQWFKFASGGMMTVVPFWRQVHDSIIPAGTKLQFGRNIPKTIAHKQGLLRYGIVRVT